MLSRAKILPIDVGL